MDLNNDPTPEPFLLPPTDLLTSSFTECREEVVLTDCKEDKSIHFSFQRWSEEPSIKLLIARIIYDAKERNLLPPKTQKVRLENHLNVLLCNLLYAHFNGAKLIISLDKNYYSMPAPSRKYMRYNKAQIAYKSLMFALRVIEKTLGNLKKTPGVWDPNTVNPFTGKAMRGTDSNSKRTTISFTEGVARFLVDFYCLTPGHIGTHPYRELIEIRHSKHKRDEEGGSYSGIRRYVPYEETKETYCMRKTLTQYNQLLSSTGIRLQTGEFRSEWILPGIVRRVFNDDFKHGGRFYGGKWQTLSSEARKKLFLNDKPTVELDFKALHAHILYQGYGLELPADDPYTLPAFSNAVEAAAMRKLVKDAFLFGLNCTSFQQWVSTITKKINNDGGFKYPSYAPELDLYGLLKEIENKHHLIQNHFHRGEGLRLQYIDSQIAEYVIRKFCKLNKPILCYHDGFRVINEDRDLLRDTMENAYKSVLKVSSPPPIEVK
ncbi:MAG: hypothetical protein SFW64_03645 [Alphaproteobacteria bacterium]|nr:hypothetical protein [Alphaproteobacteria bacterium]